MATQRVRTSRGAPAPEHAGQVAAWAASGAMALAGRPGEPPLGPPAGLVPKLQAAAALLGHRSAVLGRPLQVDPLELLGERAAVSGLGRRGATSCGGGCRLLPARDGWLAVSLARDEDVELVPAWLEQAMPATGHAGDTGGAGDAALWEAVGTAVRRSPVAHLVDRGVLVGLPVAALPTVPVAAPVAPDPLAPLPLRALRTGARRPVTGGELDGLLVVDLSALWAGPLCGSLLAAAGARVVKVESTHRPDGARRGPARFFDLVNAGKRSVAMDLRTREGREALGTLVAAADVVVEASRPRALEQLGLHAREMLGGSGNGPAVWVSITGHGREVQGRDRVAFGDDAAVGGGLVCWDARGPCFCADAVADPATGLVAAAGVLDALHAGGRWLLDVAMAGVAAHLAGPTLPSTGARPAAIPRARTPAGTGPALGADTAAVLTELGVR